MGAINHAAGSGKAITQACLFGFLIGQGSVMGLVTGCQPLLQGEALALLCQNLRGIDIGQISALGLVGSFLGGQLLAVGIGLPLPCRPTRCPPSGPG